MQKVAVFGNAGGGKSTLSKNLAAMTGLPLIPLDLIQYKPGGVEVPHEEYKKAHDAILQQDRWIVDGFGSLDTVWERLDRADTLVYLDMSPFRHYWWVTKRFLKGFLVSPTSWPKDSSVLRGTLNSYYIVGLCHKKLTPKYRAYVEAAKHTKQVYHLRSLKDIKQFYQLVQNTL